MAGSPFEKTEELMRLMGEALVTWGEIESLWRRMFPRLLFLDFKHPREEVFRKIGGRGDDELSLKEERAYALWDSLLCRSYLWTARSASISKTVQPIYSARPVNRATCK